MSKRTKTDITNISDENIPVAAPEVSVAKTKKSAEGAAAKRRVSKKTASAQAEQLTVNSAVATADDAELESLLLQVDKMLTEMTQSKWLSSDWPTLEIDFGKSKK